MFLCIIHPAARRQRGGGATGKKPLFIGEFGVPGEGPEVEAAFSSLLMTIEKERVPLACLWIYDLHQQPNYIVTGSNARAYQLRLLAEANDSRLLRLPA